MNSTWKSRRIAGIVLILLSTWSCSYLDAYLQEPQTSGNVVRTATSTCIYLDRDNRYHPLYACETAKNYQIRVLDQTHSFAKVVWQDALRSQLWRFAEKKPKMASALASSQIEIWLTAPAFRPDAALLVAWIKAPTAGYALRVPFVVDSWAFNEGSLQYTPNTGDGYKALVFSFPYRSR